MAMRVEDRKAIEKLFERYFAAFQHGPLEDCLDSLFFPLVTRFNGASVSINDAAAYKAFRDAYLNRFHNELGFASGQIAYMKVTEINSSLAALSVTVNRLLPSGKVGETVTAVILVEKKADNWRIWALYSGA